MGKATFVKIEIFSDRRALGVFKLDGPSHVFGSSGKCDICIKEPGIEPRHLEFVRDGDSYKMRTLVPLIKPTFSGVVPCEREEKLKSCQRINVGKHLIIFFNPTLELIVLSEPFRGVLFSLDKDLHCLGSSRECDFILDTPGMPPRHCAFIKSGDSYKVKTIAARNLKVNNKLIDEASLEMSDILEIEGIEMLFDKYDPAMQACMGTFDGMKDKSENCGNCKNAEPYIMLCDCKIFGNPPRNIWNDKIVCEDKIILSPRPNL